MDNIGDTATHSISSTKTSTPAYTSAKSTFCTSVGNLGTKGYDISENATILEEGLRVCPMCQSELKLFVLNYEEKLLLCENLECDYPFLEDNLPIYNTNSVMCAMSKYSRSKKTYDDASATCSITSSAWSDVDQITKALDSDFTPAEYRLKNHKNVIAQKEKVQKLLQNRDYIKNLTDQMKQINGIGRVRRITNNKYIKNLMSLQSMTGAKILQPEELKVVEKNNDFSQLKINVNTDPGNSVSCIKIELIDITKEETIRAENAAEVSDT